MNDKEFIFEVLSSKNPGLSQQMMGLGDDDSPELTAFLADMLRFATKCERDLQAHLVHSIGYALQDEDENFRAQTIATLFGALIMRIGALEQQVSNLAGLIAES